MEPTEVNANPFARLSGGRVSLGAPVVVAVVTNSYRHPYGLAKTECAPVICPRSGVASTAGRAFGELPLALGRVPLLEILWGPGLFI